MEIQPYERKAWYHETDQMGIIHHSNYIRWFEEARVDFMDKIGFGYERVTVTGIDLAVTGVSCEYKSMVRFGDRVRIECRVTELSPARLSVGYRITDAATGELRTTGETRHCYFDNAKRRPVSLKKAVPELYDLFAACLEEPFSD
ncbi:acyl-CoA thioesterase [Gorillibacterium sp. sgz500922]|uniref:acyl-CoA thioesterase n=1 Tax=Gorillibacterium sp. sgz500922 TaxID=3446694 RepID=UPI003F674F01